MVNPSANVEAALASLRERWGGAAPRWGGEVVGALAIAPQPVPDDGPRPGHPEAPPDERAISTGFRALDAILGLGGLPRVATTALRGGETSGKTTLALRAIAQTQAAGWIAAYLDLARSLDPVEAVARGIQLDWLVVITPDSLEEALAMAAMLLQDRTVDLLILDLPNRTLDPAGMSAIRLADRLHRMTALARRAGVQMLVLEPPGLPTPITGAISQIAALRLELSRLAWIRLGRDIVGQRTEVRVIRDRFGSPGRTTELRILYADGGPRDACLTRDELLRETAPGIARRPAEVARREAIRREAIHRPETAGSSRRPLAWSAPPGSSEPVALSRAIRPSPLPVNPTIPVSSDATSPPLLAPSPHSPGPRPVLLPIDGGADRAGRQTVDERFGPRRESVGSRAWGPAGDASRGGPPARPRGSVPRSRSGG